MVNAKEILNKISVAYFFFKLGWGNYLALILGATAYLTIIYTYLIAPFIKIPAILALGISAILLIIVSTLTGILTQKSGFWGKEHWMGTLSNPALNVPVGEKEILSYDLSIIGYQTGIIGIKNQIEINKVLGISTNELDKALKLQESMLERMIAMRKKAYTSEGKKVV